MAERIQALELIGSLRVMLSTGVILASEADCAYFRSLYRTLKEPTPVIKAEPPPAPVVVAKAEPLPAPVVFGKAEPPLAPAVVRKAEPALPAPIKPDTPKLHSQEKLPQPETPQRSFEEIRKIFSKIAPQTAILDRIPPDEEAKRIAERWKTKNQSAPFSILTFHEAEPQRQLLANLAVALEVFFGPAKLVAAEPIEKEKRWDAFFSVPELKLILVCDYTLWQMPHLLQFYRELPSSSERFLGNAPLFLLPDLTLYLKDPLLKRSLWKALCQKLS